MHFLPHRSRCSGSDFMGALSIFCTLERTALNPEALLHIGILSRVGAIPLQKSNLSPFLPSSQHSFSLHSTCAVIVDSVTTLSYFPHLIYPVEHVLILCLWES